MCLAGSDKAVYDCLVLVVFLMSAAASTSPGSHVTDPDKSLLQQNLQFAATHVSAANKGPGGGCMRALFASAESCGCEMTFVCVSTTAFVCLRTSSKFTAIFLITAVTIFCCHSVQFRSYSVNF